MRTSFARAALAAALGLAACAGEPQAPRPPARTLARVVLSSFTAAPGDTVRVALLAGGLGLTGLQADIGFDPGALAFAGQAEAASPLVLVHATAGRLRLLVLALDAGELPDTAATLAFLVRAPGYAASLRLTAGLGATVDLREEPVGFSPPEGAALAAALTGPRSLADWEDLLRSREAQRVPGQYVANLRYGDATLNGAINILDAAAAANVAVGNLSLLTDAARDYVIAANVHPANSPGLGEDGDAQPPGRNPDGSFVINVLDAAVIANEAVGNDQPVAGEVIPGREPRPGARAVLSGVLDSSRTLYRDTVYELEGLVIVPGGVTLTIQPGTTIEGDDATRGALAVYRGGAIVARGTRLQPIVFTCAAAVKTRGCWGGLVINGFSLLNNGEILPGGVDVNGCPQKVYATTPGYAGGCLVQDTSGMLRYVRIEYAGMAPPGHGPVPGLALLGAGSGTVVESVQVHESLGDGLFVGGGTVDVRGLVLTNNAGDGLRWEDGWVGRGQFIIVQQGPDNDHAIHGINFPLSPDAGPRSRPVLSHVTVSGPPAGQGAWGAGLFFEHGSGGDLRNVIVLRAGAAGLDVDGAASCAQAGLALGIAATMWFANPEDFSSDADCLDEAAWALEPPRANQRTDPLLLAPFNTLTPDLRPSAGSPVTAGYLVPPSDGFFDLTAGYIGAVAPATGTGSNVPWYAGWTRGW